jgi:ATP-dependent helicase HepA
MTAAAKDIAKRASAKPIQAARELAEETITSQIARLEDLAKRNPHVSASETEALKATLRETTQALSQARVRLDSIRLVFRT